jgi:ubiquinone/menaquinone biosynthesis C-methylase UbiE
MFRRLLSGCQGRALDYGCGYGDIAHAVSAQFSEIIGVDLSPERVEWARHEFSPISFRVCQANSLEFADNAFQTVISIVVINWVTDPDLYLRESHRVLAPGGKLVLAAAAPDRLRNLIRASVGRPSAELGFWSESVPQMTLRLQRHGFQVEGVDCFYDPLRESLDSLKKFVSGMVLLPMRICGMPAFAPYYGVRAVKVHKFN